MQRDGAVGGRRAGAGGRMGARAAAGVRMGRCGIDGLRAKLMMLRSQSSAADFFDGDGDGQRSQSAARRPT